VPIVRQCEKKYILHPDTPQIAIWLMHIACWMTKAINTHAVYVIVLLLYGNNGCSNSP